MVGVPPPPPSTALYLPQLSKSSAQYAAGELMAFGRVHDEKRDVRSSTRRHGINWGLAGGALAWG